MVASWFVGLPRGLTNRWAVGFVFLGSRCSDSLSYGEADLA